LKILIYTEFFFPIPGGVQTIVSELARGLTEYGADHLPEESFEVTVATRTPRSNSNEDSWPFRLVRRPSPWRLLQLVRAADVVHIAGPALLPMMISLLLRKPFVVEHHGFQTACPNGLMFFEPNQQPCPGHFMAKQYMKCFECNREIVGKTKSAYWLTLTPIRRWLSNRARHNIVPTNWLGSVLKMQRTTTVYHGVPAPRATNSESVSNPVIAFQGRMVTTKGANHLIAAAHLVRRERSDFELKLIGDGPQLHNLRTMSADLGSQVEFLGHVPDDDLDKVLSPAVAVVMPSLGGEVFGLVAAENMMRGKLLIVSDIGALKELVGEAGLVFPAGSVEALAACIRSTLENPAGAAALGMAARRRALRMFDRQSMIQAHISCYQEKPRH